jgi:hypothetical protein
MEKFTEEEKKNLTIIEIVGVGNLSECKGGVTVFVRGQKLIPRMFVVEGLTEKMKVEVDNTTEWGTIIIKKK